MQQLDQVRPEGEILDERLRLDVAAEDELIRIPADAGTNTDAGLGGRRCGHEAGQHEAQHEWSEHGSPFADSGVCKKWTTTRRDVESEGPRIDRRSPGRIYLTATRLTTGWMVCRT
jgi:hypothetical protein